MVNAKNKHKQRDITMMYPITPPIYYIYLNKILEEWSFQ